MFTAKLILIESNTTFGVPMTTTTNDDERDRLYAIAREAQLRGINPLAVQPEKPEKKRTAAVPKQPKQKASKKQKVPEPESEGEACD